MKVAFVCHLLAIVVSVLFVLSVFWNRNLCLTMPRLSRCRGRMSVWLFRCLFWNWCIDAFRGGRVSGHCGIDVGYPVYSVQTGTGLGKMVAPGCRCLPVDCRPCIFADGSKNTTLGVFYGQQLYSICFWWNKLVNPACRKMVKSGKFLQPPADS